MPQFAHIRNFRDLGGLLVQPGVITARHKLYRSAALFDATAAECIRLTDRLNVGVVIDLRSTIERNRKPDPAMPSVIDEHIPLMPARALTIGFEDGNFREIITGSWNPDTYDVCAMYRSMVGPGTEDRWRQIFSLLLKAQGRAVLFHCTNGKDRTGVAIAIVLLALGVPYHLVMRDYLRTNRSLAALQARIKARMAQGIQPGLSDKVGPLLEARPEYLNAALDAIDETYGGLAGFLEGACELSIAEDEVLRNLYLRRY